MAAPLAHSAINGRGEQTYEAHIRGVCEKAARYVMDLERYAPKSGAALTETVIQGALLHDLGKLDARNQEILRGRAKTRGHLPVNHTDAGSAALKAEKALFSALLVYAHHRGLPDFAEELRREEAIFRDSDPQTRRLTDSELESLLETHSTLLKPPEIKAGKNYGGDQSVYIRMALSCLADADHTDTGESYHPLRDRTEPPELRAGERLEALDRFISGLDGKSERSRLRREMYYACRNAEAVGGFSLCDSPVGSGKTTAVMAHLLRQAVRRGARRIFVVLPYTSIIEQAAAVYRKALVLPGERPEDVVGELHSRADFQDVETRRLTALWRAPIIVTTAVAFFETLASNRPSSLRRLHELPGSVIFIDEAHSALPLSLLPLAWRWMNVLAGEWSCYWVLGSGSLVRFWEIGALIKPEEQRPSVFELVEPGLREKLMEYELGRVEFRCMEKPKSRGELIDFIRGKPGPRLLILNTVQSAAVLASDMCEKFGRERVEHLSTALTSEDRTRTMERIRRRLDDLDDTDWTLVATSCVEAGVDFSFRTGFREESSLLSLVQSAGRVNRHGEHKSAEMWSFSLRDDSALTRNDELSCSTRILREYFNEKTSITPELCTDSIEKELNENGGCLKKAEFLMTQEQEKQFKTVCDSFKVIDSDTVTVVVDSTLAEAIRRGEGDWKAVQKKSVSVYSSKIKTWKIEKIVGDVYRWTLGYDSFLGYMRGVLDLKESNGAK